MGKLELAQIKEILQRTRTEMVTVQKETKISDSKIEKLKELFNESEKALVELKKINASKGSTTGALDIQNVMDHILKVRANGEVINPCVLQAIISSLQNINSNLGEIRLDEKDHKRGVRVEKANQDNLSST